MGLLDRFRTRVGGRAAPSTAPREPRPLERIELPAAAPFPLAEHLVMHDGLPTLDWAAVTRWAEGFPDERRAAEGRRACSDAWLAHLRSALGADYRIRTDDVVSILSSMEAAESEALMRYVRRARDRIVSVLEGVASVPEDHHETLVVFDDVDTYYRYVARYYPEEGEFAFSSGMHINSGLPHFVLVKDQPESVEPIVAHELTHACVRHLPLPAWLNEGLAVNTEDRLCGARPTQFTPAEMREKHLEFWDEGTVQEFWSGDSFLRSDEGNMLSYDLARTLTAHLAEDWARFSGFAGAADLADAGAAAARDHLGASLGALMAVVLERDDPEGLEPAPTRWSQPPKPGAFRAGPINRPSTQAPPNARPRPRARPWPR